MKSDECEPRLMLNALKRGGVSDLRDACDFAERIVNTVERAKDIELLKRGYQAFRARNDYAEDETSNPGSIFTYPLMGKDVCAPPKDKTQLGRFNAPLHPVLYLSTSREVAIAESRALSTDTCTVAVFELKRPLRLAKLLKKSGFPLGAILNEKPTGEDFDDLLLYQTADFVSRRVSDAERDFHYRSCNLIASAFKERGFDALAYRTSFWSEGWRKDGRSEEEESIFASNIVLFDPETAEPKRSSLFRISWKRPSAEFDGNGHWEAAD